MRAETRRFFWSILVQVLVVAAILRPDDLGGYQGFLPSQLLHDKVVDGLAIAWWYALAWNITSGLELFLWSRIFGSGVGGMPRQRKLLTDMLNIIIYVLTTATVAVHVFKQPVTGVFATSGIVAIVIGLALQNTLSDLFAGLALNFERPFKAGDWVTLDGNVQGMVLVTNWRATHIRTRTGDDMVVPNATIAKARLTNHMVPSKNHLANIEVPLIYGFDAAEIEDLLKTTAVTVPGVLSDPGPIVLMHEMRNDVVVWRLYFFINEFARLVIIRGQLAQAVYTAFRSGPAGAFLPRNEIWLHKADPAASTKSVSGEIA